MHVEQREIARFSIGTIPSSRLLFLIPLVGIVISAIALQRKLASANILENAKNAESGITLSSFVLHPLFGFSLVAAAKLAGPKVTRFFRKTATTTS
jgi:hypothetical protein